MSRHFRKADKRQRTESNASALPGLLVIPEKSERGERKAGSFRRFLPRTLKSEISLKPERSNRGSMQELPEGTRERGQGSFLRTSFGSFRKQRKSYVDSPKLNVAYKSKGAVTGTSRMFSPGSVTLSRRNLWSGIMTKKLRPEKKSYDLNDIIRGRDIDEPETVPMHDAGLPPTTRFEDSERKMNCEFLTLEEMRKKSSFMTTSPTPSVQVDALKRPIGFREKSASEDFSDAFSLKPKDAKKYEEDEVPPVPSIAPTRSKGTQKRQSEDVSKFEVDELSEI